MTMDGGTLWLIFLGFIVGLSLLLFFLFMDACDRITVPMINGDDYEL